VQQKHDYIGEKKKTVSFLSIDAILGEETSTKTNNKFVLLQLSSKKEEFCSKEENILLFYF
jgi:hypothetical protein